MEKAVFELCDGPLGQLLDLIMFGCSMNFQALAHIMQFPQPAFISMYVKIPNTCSLTLV